MTYDVAIVGSGIVGLAHAWRAAVRGKSVLVLERSREPRGASIRNFGLICPVCQPEPQFMARTCYRRWDLGSRVRFFTSCASRRRVGRAPRVLRPFDVETSRPIVLT